MSQGGSISERYGKRLAAIKTDKIVRPASTKLRADETRVLPDARARCTDQYASKRFSATQGD